jgi:two-component system sensor histidine kinase KdpD
MPLVDEEGQNRGRIAVSDAIDGEFTATHVGLLEAVADTIGAALERERLKQGLRDAQRQRQAFFGVISHELRTPITTIYGGVRMLSHAGSRLSYATQEQLLDDITAESERLYRLVEDLLVLSRAEREALHVAAEPIALQHLLARVAASERRLRPRSRIRVHAATDLPPVMGDSTLVEQVVRDLLANALTYAGADGPILLTVTAREGWVEVAVADEGPGIDADPPEQVFELFFQTPEAQRRAVGAGIGLYVCRELVRAMGGQTWVRRREPRGTVFGFRLRAYAEDDAPAA